MTRHQLAVISSLLDTAAIIVMIVAVVGVTVILHALFTGSDDDNRT